MQAKVTTTMMMARRRTQTTIRIITSKLSLVGDSDSDCVVAASVLTVVSPTCKKKLSV